MARVATGERECARLCIAMAGERAVDRADDGAESTYYGNS